MNTDFTQRRWFLPLAMALLTLIFFFNVIFPAPDEALPGFDLQNMHYPFLNYLVSNVQETGTIPLWNPHQFLGFSVVGNPQNGLFYPPNWFLLVFEGLGIVRGMGILVTFHIFWFGLGMAYLARMWGASPIPALLAGGIVSFGGFTAAHLYAGHYALLSPLPWLPWIMAGYHLATQKQHPAWAFPAGIALAMPLLTGHPQATFLVGVALAAQWGYEALTAPSRNAILLRTRQLVLIGIVGLALSAVTWLPFLDYLPKTARSNDPNPLAIANSYVTPAHQLITMFVPGLFGHPRENPPGYWGALWYEEMTVYVGLLPILALFLVSRFRDSKILLCLALIALGLLLTVGFNGALYLVLNRLLPILRMRAPGRASVLATVGFAGIAALVLTRLSQTPLAERSKLLQPLITRLIPLGLFVLWGGALALTTISTSLEIGGETAGRVAYMAEQLALSGIFLGLVELALWLWTFDGAPGKNGQMVRWALIICAAVGILDLWHMSLSHTETLWVFVPEAWREASVDVPMGAEAEYGRVYLPEPFAGPVNGASWTGHQTSQGYDSLYSFGWNLLAENDGGNPGSAVNRVFGVRYTISTDPLPSYGFENTDAFQLIGIRGRYFFYENPDALPRMYLVQRYSVEPDVYEARRRILDGEVSQTDNVLLATDPGCPISGEGGTATITDYQPNTVIVEVEADGPGLLVLTDQYDDDWFVEVDGEPAEMLQANVAMRGVCVPDGEHTVRYTYQPWAFYLGAVISLVSMVLLLLLGGWRLFPKRAGK